MHGFWLEFEPKSLEDEYLSNGAQRFQRQNKRVVYVTCALKAVVVGLASKYGGTAARLSWLHVLWGLVEIVIWSGDERRLVAPWVRKLVVASRIVNAIFCSMLSPFWSVVFLNRKGSQLDFLISSGIVVHALPLMAKLPFRIEFPTQLFVTTICLALAGRGTCKNGFETDWDFTENRLGAMFMIFEPRRIPDETRCLHLFVVMHIFIGLVVVPYVVWSLEHSSRVDYVVNMPSDRKPPRFRNIHKIPLAICILHVFVMIYGFCILWKYIEKTPLPGLIEKWGWSGDYY